MSDRIVLPSRRLFIASAAVTVASARGAFANLLEDLTKTPPQTEGPFYPNKLPLDTDNDLIIINDTITPAVGEITHLTGRVLDAKGNPVKNAVVEVWQCDNNGVYLHTADSGPKKNQQDQHFQGFGRFVTSSTGEYYFRTIKPVPYPGRTPHIHYKIKKGGKHLLTTQCYVKGHSGNEKDGIFKAASKNPKDQAAIEVVFEKMKDSKAGELAAKWDVVLGVTPEM